MKTIAIMVFLAMPALSCAQSTKQKSLAMPVLQLGVMGGRDGAAFGPGISAQINWKHFGFYGFAGRSSVDHEAGGVKARLSDKTLGFGLAYRAFPLGRIMLGGFAQAAYYGSHVRAIYFNPAARTVVTYHASDRDPLTTIGLEIDCRIARGVSVVVRPGKDFGNNFAATSAGGFSVNGGVLVDVMGAGRGLRKLFR